LKNLGEKNSFSENLMKLKKTCQKNSFWEKFAELSPTVRCPSISKKPVEICGGDIVPLYICIERVAFEM
jgi:hypothetical protein